MPRKKQEEYDPLNDYDIDYNKKLNTAITKSLDNLQAKKTHIRNNGFTSYSATFIKADTNPDQGDSSVLTYINNADNYTLTAANTDFYDNKAGFATDLETEYIELNTGTGNQKRMESSKTSGGNNEILPPLAQLIPSWGYSDFIRERMNWQKGIGTFGTEPGWFYFKIFFHFNTATGLFGGILKDSDGNKYPGHNCADKYFEAWKGHYYPEAMNQRQDSLRYFVNCLNNISVNAPWFFQAVNGLDKVGIENMNEPWKNNSIEIKCLEESIDMRLTKLMDYYKYAVFDYINYKEIIPENLRKFDMTIVLFGIPIRYFDTHSQIMGEEFKPRQLNPGVDSNSSSIGYNRMTFKIYSFKNCEFDMSSFNASTPSEVTVNEPFQMGKSSIKINYQKVFSGTQDSFSGHFVSDLGIVGDGTADSDVDRRLSKMAEAYKRMKNDASSLNTISTVANTLGFGKYFDQYTKSGLNSAYKALIDETEMMCQDYYNNTGSKLMNIGLNKVLGSSEMGSLTPPEYAVGSDYYKKQLKEIHNGKEIKGIGTEKQTEKSSASGRQGAGPIISTVNSNSNTITDSKNNKNNPNSDYYKEYLKNLHQGTVFPHRGTVSPTRKPSDLTNYIQSGTLGPTARPITNNPSLAPEMPGGPNTSPTAKPIQNKYYPPAWDNQIHTPVDPTKKALEEQKKAAELAQKRAELRKQLFGDYDSKTGIGTPYFEQKLRDLYYGTIDQRQSDNLKKDFSSDNSWE